jgi:precorrin-3B synthase
MTQRGWCPSLFAPMPTGDGLLLRLKPRAGVLTAAAAQRLADLAERHGNGLIEITGRANLQLRGCTEEGAAAIAAAAVADGLGHADPQVERRRSIVASPLIGDDPAIAPGTGGVVSKLEALLAADTALAELPEKFGFAVDGGGGVDLRGLRADITIRVEAEQSVLALDGGEDAVTCRTPQAAALAIRLAKAFLRLAAPGQRMRDAAGVFAAARLAPDARLERAAEVAVVAGFLPYAGLPRGALAAVPPFGRTTARQLRKLADLAATCGDATLRLAPSRALLLPRIQAAQAPALAALLREDGWITDPADPRLSVVTCPGSPGCAQGSSDTHADAARLAAARPAGALWHLSGCAKGCAHPAAAAVTLVADAGGYRLVRHGRAGDTAEPARDLAACLAILQAAA